MKYKKIGESLYIKGRIGWKGLKKSEYLKNGDYRIINGSNIIDNKIDWSNCGYISKERYNESPEIMLQKGDILITKDGTIGKVAMVNELKKPTTVASGLFVLRNTAPFKWDTKYIFNFLQSNKFKKFVLSRTEGSVIPHLYQKDFMTLEIPELEINEQRKIARRLDTVQHKLDLNNQINDNLSKLQQLNLSQLINRKLYKIVKIGDLEIIVSDHVANGSFKSLKDNVSYFDNPNYALFIRNIDFKKDLDGNKKYIDKKSYNYLKKSHLFGGEVVISNVADVGSVHRVPFIKKPMVVGNNQIFIKSKHFSMTDYLYVYFQSFWGQSSISSITSGSAQQKFNKTDFRSLEIPIPSEKWIQSNISPYVTLQDKIFNENQSLKQIKATLLNHCF